MAEHKLNSLVFNLANQKLADFLDELQKLAKDAFGVAAQATIEQFAYAKMPPYLASNLIHHTPLDQKFSSLIRR